MECDLRVVLFGTGVQVEQMVQAVEEVNVSDWLYGTIELIVTLVDVVVLPELFTNSRDTKFIYPSAGYYERFIGK